jgi:hypothetical protein
VGELEPEQGGEGEQRHQEQADRAVEHATRTVRGRRPEQDGHAVGRKHRVTFSDATCGHRLPTTSGTSGRQAAL